MLTLAVRKSLFKVVSIGIVDRSIYKRTFRYSRIPLLTLWLAVIFAPFVPFSVYFLFDTIKGHEPHFNVSQLKSMYPLLLGCVLYFLVVAFALAATKLRADITIFDGTITSSVFGFYAMKRIDLRPSTKITIMSFLSLSRGRKISALKIEEGRTKIVVIDRINHYSELEALVRDIAKRIGANVVVEQQA